jgi:hypothetical protein
VRSLKTAGALLVASSFCIFSPRSAAADGSPLHADVGVEGGVMRRVLTSNDGYDASFGPVAQLYAHVAVLPMLRAGLYVSGDISPQSQAPARHLLSGGLHAKITPPWIRTDVLTTWLFFGFGYAAAYAPSFHLPSSTAAGTTVDTFFPGASGHFFEIPVGIGAGWRIRKPWQLFAELGARIGFGHGGELYEGRPGSAVGQPDSFVQRGYDSFAVFLMAGVALDL